MKFISDLATNSRAWLVLALSALGLEIVALYFQYVMGLNPCIMCIYQRTALWGVFFAGVVGFLGNSLLVTRLLAYIIWGTSSIWGMLIAIEHVDMQTSTLSFLYVCEIVPNFPQWAPLHEWLPSLFEASGDCGDINWQFLGFSMPQVMIAVFAVYSAILVFLLAIRLIKDKTI